MHNPLPIIDVDGFELNARGKRDVAQALDQAFRDVGFCYLANTGVTDAEINTLLGAARSFHALSREAKLALRVNEYHRGYIAPSTSVIRSSSVAEVTQPNLSESFMVMHEVAPDDPRFGAPLQGPNQWPADLPEFRPVVESYRDSLSRVGYQLLPLLALALGQPETFFAPYFRTPTVWLRLLCYPPQPDEAPASQYGAAPHTDYGFVTILAQDQLGGLQVRWRDGSWRAAPPQPDTFVLNVADMLARWSGGRWSSTPHRVRNSSSQVRYSAPFFFDTSMDASIRPIAGADRQAVQFGEYVMARLNQNYAYRDQRER